MQGRAGRVLHGSSPARRCETAAAAGSCFPHHCRHCRCRGGGGAGVGQQPTEAHEEAGGGRVGVLHHRIWSFPPPDTATAAATVTVALDTATAAATVTVALDTATHCRWAALPAASAARGERQWRSQSHRVCVPPCGGEERGEWGGGGPCKLLCVCRELRRSSVSGVVADT